MIATSFNPNTHCLILPSLQSRRNYTPVIEMTVCGMKFGIELCNTYKGGPENISIQKEH